MKRSSAVPLMLVTAMAATMISCQEKPTRYCVDENNVVLKDEDCQNERWIAAGAHWYCAGAHGYVAPGTQGGSTRSPAGGFSYPA